MTCHYCQDKATRYHEEDFLCERHSRQLYRESKLISIIDVPKTQLEKMLCKRYLKLMDKATTFEDYQSIAEKFKVHAEIIKSKSKLYETDK